MSVVSQSNQQMLFELLKSISTDNQLQINERALEQFITQRCAYFHTNRFELEIGNNINELNKITKFLSWQVYVFLRGYR